MGTNTRCQKQLIDKRRDVIVRMFDHYEEGLIKKFEKKGDITDILTVFQ